MAGNRSTEAAPLLVRHREDLQHAKDFVRVMMLLGASDQGAQILLQRYHIEQFLKGMVEVRAAMEAKRRLRGQTNLPVMFPDIYTVDHMVIFQAYPIGTSLLRLESYLQPHAVRMFQDILRYMGIEDGKFLTRAEEVALIQRLQSLLLRYPALRDEACAQLQKQTCDNPHLGGCVKAWELMRVLVASFPPSQAFAGPLTEYFLAETQDEEAPPVIHHAVIAVWGALDRALKVGPRKHVPSTDEVEFVLENNALATTVYMYDDASEPLAYDMTTTVGDALRELVKAIKLKSCNSFGLFEMRPMKTEATDALGADVKPKAAEPAEVVIEHRKLDVGRYLGDVVAESKAAGGKAFTTCKFLLKKRIFRFTDDVVTEPMFIHLCYSQVRHDYLAGYYPVVEEMAAELAALQTVAELGPWSDAQDTTDCSREVKESLPPEQLAAKPFENWVSQVLEVYRKLESMSPDDAKLRALRILLELPIGGSNFFHLKKDVDPPNTFPDNVIMGVNKRGLRFLHSKSKATMHSVELKDIEEYASNDKRFYISMLVNGAMHGFEFMTTEGEEVCTLLDTHIADALRFQAATSSDPPAKAAPAYRREPTLSPEREEAEGRDKGSSSSSSEASSERKANGAMPTNRKLAMEGSSSLPGSARSTARQAGGPASPAPNATPGAKGSASFPGPLPSSSSGPSTPSGNLGNLNGSGRHPAQGPAAKPQTNGETRTSPKAGAPPPPRVANGAAPQHSSHRQSSLQYGGRARPAGSPLPRSKLGLTEAQQSKAQEGTGQPQKELEMSTK